MLFGFYEHALDNKGRLVVPSKFRSEIGSILYILRGYEGSLAIYKADEFAKMVEEIEKLPFTKKDARTFIRMQLASVCELEIDKQGRIQIPTHLLTKYSISKDVVIIGVGDHIEVWDKKAYSDYEAQGNEEFDRIAESLPGNE